MLPESSTIQVPLQTDEQGTIRVSKTRVTLDTVIARYLQGDSPEAIHEGFDVLPLNDIYAVISYYLANRDELDHYLQQREAEALRIRQEIEANYTPEQRERHQRLLEKIEQKRNQQDS